MTAETSKCRIIGMVATATLAFSVFRRAESFLPLGDWLASIGWSMVPILIGFTLVGLVSTGVAVLLFLPPLLGTRKRQERLPAFLRIDLKTVALGVLSFVLFALLASGISSSLNIFRGDWSLVLAQPDIRPAVDVIGWGYFMLALAPGIWEELAFRGLIQSSLRQRFSTTSSILLSATFFGLFHLTNLLTESPGTTLGGMIMAFCFGLAWGVMTVHAESVVPAMISHYLVDSVGQVFINVAGADPVRTTIFLLLLTLAFPVFSIVLANLMYHRELRLVGA